MTNHPGIQNGAMGLDVEFEFEVGESERHRVAFHWRQVWGYARITVDGVEALREKHPFGYKTTRR
jgi:hypothetical protein